jgi:FixJ family two-component response regulator
MRKPRAIIFDDEIFILNMLKDFFLMRGYEVLSYSDPTTICPLYGDGGDVCTNDQPCCDVMVTDFQMPGVNGVELLEFQARKGCKVDNRNKSVISGYIDAWNRRRVDQMGCNFLQKPFTLYALAEWLSACEKRIDLSGRLATRRREDRFESHREVTFSLTSTDQLYTGIAVNMSPSGLCLKIPAPLRRDETIKLHASNFHSCQQGSVRWVKQIESNAYIAGVSCS